MLLHFNELTNQELSKSVNIGFKKLRISEKVSKLILTRLKILELYKNGLNNLNIYLLKSGMFFFLIKYFTESPIIFGFFQEINL